MVYHVILFHCLLSSLSPLYVPVMLGDTPALPDLSSQKLEWTYLEIGQQAFLFIVYEIALVIVPTLCIDFTFFLPHSVTLPLPIISGSPRNNSFFQGLDLVFTCSITLGNVVDTPVTIRGTWNRNGTQLINGAEDGRITIINPPMSTPPYDITIRFNPLKVGDNGTYECDVTVTPQDGTFIHSATTSNSRTISVLGMMMILSLC